MESSTCTSTFAVEESHSPGSPAFQFEDNSLVEALYHSYLSNAQHSTRSNNTRPLSIHGAQRLHRLSTPVYDLMHHTMPISRDNSSSANSSERSLRDILDEAINISNEILLNEDVIEALSRKQCQVKQNDKNHFGTPQ